MSSLLHSKAHRLTKLLQIKYPILSAPMAATASGKLAGSVSKAGGLGMIGGGYLDQHKDMKLWIQEQFQEAEKITNGTLPIGIGFISWCLIKQPDLLLYSLELNPKCVMLSFGDIPKEFIQEIHSRGVLLICQVQTVQQALTVAKQGADIIVAQGSEAGKKILKF